MKRWNLIIGLSLLTLACQTEPAQRASLGTSPNFDRAEFERTHADLSGPGGVELAADPCPEIPNGQPGCASLISARRISWWGYLGKWMRVLRLFDVPLNQPWGPYANLPSAQFNLGVDHPERAIARLDDPDSRSMFTNLHAVLGEPSDEFGREQTTIAAYRGQHSVHITAGAVKQACRISTWSADILTRHVAGQSIGGPNAAALSEILDLQASGGTVNTILAFKPEFGLLTYGRRLSASELDTVNGALGTGSTRGTQFSSFRTALSALMCSTSALTE